jgi:hypothetical protein
MTMKINRKGNRTISQDVARSNPKWKNVGSYSRVLLERIPQGEEVRMPAHMNRLVRKEGKWVSASKTVSEFLLASIQAEQEAAQAPEHTHTDDKMVVDRV